MIKRMFLLAVSLPLWFTAPATAGPKAGPIAGNWNCRAHGTSQGDISFTLSLTQDKEAVDGSITAASPIGGTQISSGTFRRHMLEIHVDTPQGNYVLLGKYNKGHLDGTWSNDTEKGAWEGVREGINAKHKKHSQS